MATNQLGDTFERVGEDEELAMLQKLTGFLERTPIFVGHANDCDQESDEKSDEESKLTQNDMMEMIMSGNTPDYNMFSDEYQEEVFLKMVNKNQRRNRIPLTEEQRQDTLDSLADERENETVAYHVCNNNKCFSPQSNAEFVSSNSRLIFSVAHIETCNVCRKLVKKLLVQHGIHSSNNGDVIGQMDLTTRKLLYDRSSRVVISETEEEIFAGIAILCRNHLSNYTDYNHVCLSERYIEAAQRAELAEGCTSVTFATMIAKVKGKCKQNVREMMNRGEIFVTNNWDLIVEVVKGQYTKNRLNNQNLTKDNETSTQSGLIINEKEILAAIDTLVSAEKEGNKALEESLRSGENVLTLDQIGYLLNATNMARISGLLFLQTYVDDYFNTARSLEDMAEQIEQRISLADRLTIKHYIHLVKNGHFPPYEKHGKDCPVCKMPVDELLEEYQVPFDVNAVKRMDLRAREIMHLSSSDYAGFLQTTNDVNIDTIEKASKKAGIGLAAMLQNHLRCVS